jgi:hypothetical protein
MAREEKLTLAINMSYYYDILLKTTCNNNYTHFQRFLRVLEYSLIGVEFPPTIARRILLSVKKIENFNTLFCFKSLKCLSNSFAKNVF